MQRLETYADFADRLRTTKRRLFRFLIEGKSRGKSLAGYAAPRKGNTLLNHCGIRTDFLDYTVDRNPYKHGKYLPGTHIPIFSPEKIAETKPDYVLIDSRTAAIRISQRVPLNCNSTTSAAPYSPGPTNAMNTVPT